MSNGTSEAFAPRLRRIAAALWALVMALSFLPPAALAVTVLKISQDVLQLLHHPVTEQINSLSSAVPEAPFAPLAC